MLDYNTRPQPNHQTLLACSLPYWQKKATTRGVPRRSPIQVLAARYRAWLRWSDENRWIIGAMAIAEIKRAERLLLSSDCQRHRPRITCVKRHVVSPPRRSSASPSGPASTACSTSPGGPTPSRSVLKRHEKNIIVLRYCDFGLWSLKNWWYISFYSMLDNFKIVLTSLNRNAVKQSGGVTPVTSWILALVCGFREYTGRLSHRCCVREKDISLKLRLLMVSCEQWENCKIHAACVAIKYNKMNKAKQQKLKFRNILFCWATRHCERSKLNFQNDFKIITNFKDQMGWGSSY